MAYVNTWKTKNTGMEGLAKALGEHCIEDLGSTDNISIVIVFFENMQSDAWKA